MHSLPGYSTITDQKVHRSRKARGVMPLLRPIGLLTLALALMAPTCVTTKPIAAPPSYSGSSNGSAACATTYQTTGFAPDDTLKHPLFLYLVGTADDYAAEIPRTVTQALAARGFVALSIGYDNSWLTWAFGNKTNVSRCIFDATKSASLIAKACALPNVDCKLGIATWGHSLGGFLAMRGSEFEPRIQATWAAGVGRNVVPYTLPATKLRLINGVNDAAEHTPADMEYVTGANPPAACAASSTQCLRTNGSGWVIVQPVAGITPDHCWFREGGCGSSSQSPASGFLDPSTSLPYTLAANADWVQATIFSFIQSQQP